MTHAVTSTVVGFGVREMSWELGKKVGLVQLVSQVRGHPLCTKRLN